MNRSASRALVSCLALAGVISALLSAPAAAAAATTQTASCVDGGGIRWSAKVVWGDAYVGDDGVRRVSVYDAGWTTSGRQVKTDSRIRTYEGGGTQIQQLDWTGSFDYQVGQTYKVRNPRNPDAKSGPAQVKISLGVDGDGYGECTVTFTQPGTTTPATASDRYEADVVTATNQERTSERLVALAPQSCVDSFAESQARAMAADEQMYHQKLEPILAKCNLHMVGENVAYGYPSGAAVTEAWMNSPGHRANILSSGYRLLGVGAAQDGDGRWYSSQVFGA